MAGPAALPTTDAKAAAKRGGVARLRGGGDAETSAADARRQWRAGRHGLPTFGGDGEGEAVQVSQVEVVDRSISPNSITAVDEVVVEVEAVVEIEGPVAAAGAEAAPEPEAAGEVEVAVEWEMATPRPVTGFDLNWTMESGKMRLAHDAIASPSLMLAWEARPAWHVVAAAMWLYDAPPSVHDTPNLYSKTGVLKPMNSAKGLVFKCLDFARRETDPDRPGAAHWRVSLAQSAMGAAVRAHGLVVAAEAVRGVLTVRRRRGVPSPAEVHTKPRHEASCTRHTRACTRGATRVAASCQRLG
jgi:hypothetical protein